MRITYLINSVEGGGAALPVPRIVRALESHGAQVSVFALTRRDGRALQAFADAGVPVTVRDGGEDDHRSACRWVQDVLASSKPDVLWTSLSRATLLGQRAARRLGVPVVSWQHSAHLKPANALLLRCQQRMSALWISDSAQVSELTARRLGVGPERLLTWPIFAADAAAPRAMPWQAGHPVRLGSLGRLHPVKGYDVLIHAIALLQRGGFRAPVAWNLTIAGEGQERQRLSRLVADLPPGRVQLAPFTSDPSAFLAKLHGYVQPSRSEGFCIAAHEAMQAGLPVLASAVGELSNTIDNGRTGWLVDAGDVEELADGLFAFLSEPNRLAEMGQAARRRVLDRYGQEQFTATAGAILERLSGIVRARRPGGEPMIARLA